MIGRIDDCPVYLEAKFNKKMMACSMKRVEEHQAFYLDEFAKIPNAKCYLAWGIQVARGDCRSYIFDWRAVSELYKKGHSFHIKELEKLPYNEIHKGTFQFANIITKEDIIKACGDIYDKS
jgi:penicillin-binding protein-related factor A (putative recombinase)